MVEADGRVFLRHHQPQTTFFALQEQVFGMSSGQGSTNQLGLFNRMSGFVLPGDMRNAQAIEDGIKLIACYRHQISLFKCRKNGAVNDNYSLDRNPALLLFLSTNEGYLVVRGGFMVRILFGEFLNGRLDRATYLAYSGLLMLFVLFFIFYLMSTIVLDLSDLEAAQRQIIELGRNTPKDILVIGALITFVQINLVIKRLRDTGLIVGLTLAVVFMLYAMLPIAYFLGGLELSMLALMFIPSDTFTQAKLA